MSSVLDDRGKTIVRPEEEFHPSVRLLLPSGLLDFGGAGFGHLDGGLTLGVEQRSLQRSRPALGVGGSVAGTPRPELVLTVADVLLPVTGDLAGDLVRAIVAGGVSQAVATVAVVGNTFSELSVCSRAVGHRPRFLMFLTFVVLGSFVGVGERQAEQQQQQQCH